MLTRSRTHGLARRLLGILTRTVPLVLVSALFLPASGAAPTTPPTADPHGDNGTVKIAELGDIDSPNNDPHVGCTFQVEWYGFDEGPDIVSSVSFESWAPTQDATLAVDGDPTVFVGGDPATGAGTPTGLDGVEVYTMHFTGDPLPTQGYHVKLTIHTPGSIGNDTKSKVFWVMGCAPIVPSAPALVLHKSVTDSADDDSIGSLGEVLTYSFTVTNTGDEALTDLTITDPTIPALAGGAPCVASLAVGATTSCPLLPAATHVVSPADVTAGVVTNVATATGTSPTSGLVTDTDLAMISTEPPTPPAGLSISKTADPSEAGPGEVVTYTLTARNTGPGAALGVVVTDALPSGTTYRSVTGTGCTYSGGIVTCAIGTLPSASSSVVTVKVTVDPLPPTNDPHGHQLDITKIESHLSVPGGTTRTATSTCPSGYLATDGSVRLDAVDQGTGTFSDAGILASTATSDGTGWTGTVQNAATGQLQGKVEVVCVSTRTDSTGGHSHPLVVTGPVSTTQTWGPGTHDVGLTCPTGTVAITPGWLFASGSGVVRGDSRDGTGWHFTIDVPASATALLTIRCLATTLGTDGGHVHGLVLDQLSDTITVPAGQAVEHSLTCTDGAKGIVASTDIDAGLLPLGNDPRPKTRVWRFTNPTASPLTARIGLLCVSVRTTESGPPGDHDVVNTAHVSTTSPDATTSDDSAQATVRVVSALSAASVATLYRSSGHTRVSIPVTSTRTRAATAVLLALHRVAGTGLRTGSVLAGCRPTLRVGSHQVRLTARRAAVRALRHGDIHRARLVIVTHDGQREVRIVTIRR